MPGSRRTLVSTVNMSLLNVPQGQVGSVWVGSRVRTALLLLRTLHCLVPALVYSHLQPPLVWLSRPAVKSVRVRKYYQYEFRDDRARDQDDGGKLHGSTTRVRNPGSTRKTVQPDSLTVPSLMPHVILQKLRFQSCRTMHKTQNGDL